MKTRNKVKVNAKGNYIMTGLNSNEKQSLKNKRQELMQNVDASVVDQYIIALYDKEANEVYFVGENSNLSDEKAIII
jgi:hypothetical protein